MKFPRETIDTTTLLAANPRVLKFCVAGSALYHDDPKDLDFLVLVSDNVPVKTPRADLYEAAAADFEGVIAAADGEYGTGFLGCARWLFGPDWITCGGEYDDQDDKWGAIRKDNVNLIVTVDPAWYERAKLANEVCYALKLQDKGDRIVVYRVVRDGYSQEQANARRDGSR